MGQTGQFKLLSGELQVFARDLGEDGSVSATGVSLKPEKISCSCRRSQQRNNVHRNSCPLHITPYRQAGSFKPIRKSLIFQRGRDREEREREKDAGNSHESCMA